MTFYNQVMTNTIKEVVSQAGKVGSKVSGVQSFLVSNAKWLVTGLAVVLAGALLVPLIQRLPFLSRFTSGGRAIAGIALMVIAGFVAMLNFGVTQFLAAGLGIAGAISLLTVVLSRPLAIAQNAVASVGGM